MIALQTELMNTRVFNLAVHWFIKTIKVAFSINNVINKSQWF